MLATTQGAPALIAAEWSPDGLTPLAVWTAAAAVVLA
jgi:hypothetical protein